MDLDIGTLDLEEIVGDVVEIIGSLAAERGNKIEVHLDARISRALAGDAARIRQVLLNLATNAVKFTYNGTIEIAAGEIGRNGRTTEVEIAVRVHEGPVLHAAVRHVGVDREAPA